MDINQLEVFLGVANEKSFSRAAEALHRTQPAVSQAIRRLENELGERPLPQFGIARPRLRFDIQPPPP